MDEKLFKQLRNASLLLMIHNLISMKQCVTINKILKKENDYGI
jgi:hypothetical protein